ncbi:MAG: helicase associated domain-containing protein [Clostridia bacterium]|nr:helicase associated domain-containing protein [Clostridia bacterium]
MRITSSKVIELLKAYKEEYGNLWVPINYETAEGFKLGKLVRSIKRGNRRVTAEERAKLEELGFVWKCYSVLSFDEILELLKEYKKEHKNLHVPRAYCTTDGIRLGNLVSSIRKGERIITSEEKAKLDELGFVWRCRHTAFSFDEILELLEEYKKEHKNLLVPQKYCTPTGIKLGVIVSSIRDGNRRTTVEEKAKLDEIGFIWKVR